MVPSLPRKPPPTTPPRKRPPERVKANRPAERTKHQSPAAMPGFLFEGTRTHPFASLASARHCRPGARPKIKVLDGGLGLCSSPVALIGTTRHLEWRGAPVGTGAPTMRIGWSAGRRSAAASGFATLMHEARAPRGGLRNPVPVSAREAARSQGLPEGVSQTPGASRRSIPYWGTEKGNTGAPAP